MIKNNKEFVKIIKDSIEDLHEFKKVEFHMDFSTNLFWFKPEITININGKHHQFKDDLEEIEFCSNYLFYIDAKENDWQREREEKEEFVCMMRIIKYKIEDMLITNVERLNVNFQDIENLKEEDLTIKIEINRFEYGSKTIKIKDQTLDLNNCKKEVLEHLKACLKSNLKRNKRVRTLKEFFIDVSKKVKRITTTTK